MVLKHVISKIGFYITGFYHRPILYEIVQFRITNYMDTVRLYQEYINFELPSDTVNRRTLKF